jgi:uncharacterized protein HemX
MCDHCCCGKNASRFLAGIAAGISLAVGGYYFFTKTAKGKQIKKQLAKKGEELAAEFKEVVDEIEEQSAEWKKKVGSVGNELTHLTELRDRVESLRDRGRRAVKFFTSGGKKLA